MMTGVHALVRRTHEERVLGVLRERGALSRGEIASLVGLSRTTLSEITSSLLRRGAIIIVNTDADLREGSGRPAERLALDPDSGQFMGVDFGHRRVNVVIADASHEVIASGTARYAEEAEWPERLASAFDLIDRVGAESGVHLGALQAIGIGIPGPFVSHQQLASRELWGSRKLAFGVDVAFSERYSAAVIIDNNTRFAALAEAIHSSGGAVNDLVYIRISDGVGGGLVVGGRLIMGSVGLAGELGHVTVERNGSRCRCGKDGCLEQVASVPAILAACRSRGVDVNSLDELEVEVKRGQPIVDEVLRGVGTAIGIAVGSTAMALNPSLIVIAGAITRIAPAIVQYAAATIRFELWPIPDAVPLVRASELNDDDGAIGAVAALFHQSPLLAGYPEPASTARSPQPQRSSS